MSRIDYPVILIFLVRLCGFTGMRNGVGEFTGRDTNIVILGSSEGSFQWRSKGGKVQRKPKRSTHSIRLNNILDDLSKPLISAKT